MLLVTKQIKDVDRKWWNVSTHSFASREALELFLGDEAKDAGLRKGDKLLRDGSKIRYIVKEVRVVSTWTVTF